MVFGTFQILMNKKDEGGNILYTHLHVHMHALAHIHTIYYYCSLRTYVPGIDILCYFFPLYT